MRITEIDLQTEDIEWYAIDSEGRIAEFFSGGSGAVPEFICQSRENLDTIGEFFTKIESTKSERVLCNKNLDYPRKDFLEECKLAAKKGIYCLDIGDSVDTANEYRFVCKPISPLFITELPQHIQNILRGCKIPDSNFQEDKTVVIGEGLIKP